MTGDKANLINYRKCDNGPIIRFAGGDENPTIGFGNLKFGALRISEVLHVKGLKYNLLSMSQLVDKGTLSRSSQNYVK